MNEIGGLIKALYPWHDNKMNKPNKNTIIVLPLGACEQHGPHLPCETDAIIAAEFAERIDREVGFAKLKILETEKIGYSIEHLDYSGTQSLQYDEAIERWLKIIETEYNLGHEKFLLLNAHGGNSPLLTIVATEARTKFDALVVATSWTRFGLPEELSEMNKAIDIHAGQIETSIMLAIDPALVNMGKAQNFPSAQSDFIKNFRHLRAYGPHAFGWKMSDLNPSGAVGNAKYASAKKGELILEYATKGLVELVRDMAAFDLEQIR